MEKLRQELIEIVADIAELEVSEAAVKTTVHRMRKRFGTLLRAEVAQLVEHPDDVESEIRHLFEAAGPRAF